MKQKTVIQKIERAITVVVPDDYPDERLEKYIKQHTTPPHTKPVDLDDLYVEIVDQEELGMEQEVTTETDI
jgi:hypothetical protein